MLAIAGVFSLLSAIAAVALGRSEYTEAPPPGTHDVTNSGAVPSEPVPQRLTTANRGAVVAYDAAALLNSAAPSIRPPSTTIELPVV